jgi:hypothetical protein
MTSLRAVACVNSSVAYNDAELSPIFIPLGGPQAHEHSVEKHTQEWFAEPQALRSGPTASRGRRDDKGEGGAPMGSGCWTEGVFHHLGCAARPMNTRSKNLSTEGRGAPQVPPLRYAPVGMTSLRAVACVNSSVAHDDAELSRFSSPWVGRKAHDSSGRDDNSKGGAYSRFGNRTENLTKLLTFFARD